MLSPWPVNAPLGPVCDAHQLRVASSVPAPDSFPRPTPLWVMLLSWIAAPSAPGLMVMPSPILAVDGVLDHLHRPTAGHVREHDAGRRRAPDRVGGDGGAESRSETAAPSCPPPVMMLPTMLTWVAGGPSCWSSSMCVPLAVMRVGGDLYAVDLALPADADGAVLDGVPAIVRCEPLPGPGQLDCASGQMLLAVMAVPASDWIVSPSISHAAAPEVEGGAGRMNVHCAAGRRARS